MATKKTIARTDRAVPKTRKQAEKPVYAELTSQQTLRSDLDRYVSILGRAMDRPLISHAVRGVPQTMHPPANALLDALADIRLVRVALEMLRADADSGRLTVRGGS
jgi:hypothetical protein